MGDWYMVNMAEARPRASVKHPFAIQAQRQVRAELFLEMMDYCKFTFGEWDPDDPARSWTCHAGSCYFAFFNESDRMVFYMRFSDALDAE